MSAVKAADLVVMSEQQLMDCVVGTKAHPGLARVMGWRIAHFRPAMTSRGMRTAVSADGAGFPDLVMIRPPRLLIVELKSAVGIVSDEQRAWLGDFADLHAMCVDVCVWRPAQWYDGTIQRVLAR